MRRLGLLIGLLWWLAYADSYQPLLNHERMTQLFMEMARIESGSENEAAMCEFVAKQLRELGAETVVIDEASKQIGGTGGNVFARFTGTVNAPPLLLNAHVDTVYSTEGIQLIRDETEIRTDGKTILGADNKAGVAIISGGAAHAQGAQPAPSAAGGGVYHPRGEGAAGREGV
jgi:acetylornithine deacetylase/succinyl-diaminopimelate desuccinylase-like protein